MKKWPLERGWSGQKLPGTSQGPPDPINSCKSINVKSAPQVYVVGVMMRVHAKSLAAAQNLTSGLNTYLWVVHSGH